MRSSARVTLALAAAGAAAAVVGCGTAAGGSPALDAGADATLDAAAPDGSDAGPDVVPRLGRTLALDINSAEDGNYLTALGIARDAGVQAINLTIDWSSVESPRQGDGDGGAGDAGDGGDAGVTYFNPNLHIANLVFAGAPQVSFAFRAVDTVGPAFPSDLQGRSFDDPSVVARYNAAQDYVFGQIPDVVLSMYVVGNELDLGLGADPARWTAYAAFFAGAAAHAHALRAGVKVGSVVTLAGALAHPDLVRATLVGADFLGVTYYPLLTDLSVRPPSVVRADVDALVALYPSTPIFVREAGYPSSPTSGSSPAMQAAFVGELFRAWDAHADRMPLVTFFTMNEYGPAALTELAKYYGTSDPRFLGYLGSLGLRTYAPGSGTNKPAWDALVRGARARGW